MVGERHGPDQARRAARSRLRATGPACPTTASAIACCCSAAAAPRARWMTSGLGIRPAAIRRDRVPAPTDGALRHLDVLRPGPRQGLRLRPELGRLPNWKYDPALNKWLDHTVTSPPTGCRAATSTSGSTRRAARSSRSAATATARTTPTSGSGTRPTGVWAQAMRAASSPVPDGRYYHSVAYDPIRRLLLMVGGHVNVTGKNADVNDSWEWDTNLSAWSETAPTTVKPLARGAAPDGVQSVRGTTLPVRRHRPRGHDLRPPPNSGST